MLYGYFLTASFLALSRYVPGGNSSKGGMPELGLDERQPDNPSEFVDSRATADAGACGRWQSQGYSSIPEYMGRTVPFVSCGHPSSSFIIVAASCFLLLYPVDIYQDSCDVLASALRLTAVARSGLSGSLAPYPIQRGGLVGH